MTKIFVSTYDHATGKMITSEMTDKDHADGLQQFTDAQAAAKALAAAKKSAQAKLAALGLTADEIAAL